MEPEFIPVLCMCLISIAISCVCISLYILKRSTIDKELSFYLLGYQLIDMILCIITIINPNQSKGTFCTFQGFSEQFISFLLIEWDIIIVVKIYKEIHKEKFPLKLSIAISVMFSLVLAIIPILTGSYSKNVIFCSISTTGNYNYLIFLFFYIPFWLSCIFILVLLSKVEKIIKSRMRDKESRSEYLKTLRLVPYSLIFCYFFLSLSRIIEVSSGMSESLNSFLIFSITLCRSHGFFNGLLGTIRLKSTLSSTKPSRADSLQKISNLLTEESKSINLSRL